MSRISGCFARLAAANRKALIPYITAGDGGLDLTVPLMHALVGAGADIIELGVPFSDPMADGPVIQLACERALAHGTRLADVLEMVKAFRVQDEVTPVVLMGYLNPVEMMGYKAFAEQAATAGVDGVLLVDMPPEEADDVPALMQAHGLDLVFLLAPTSKVERVEAIGKAGSGYVYYVSLKGVTGSAQLNTAEVAERVGFIRQHVSQPVGVGFGIRDAASAKAVAAVADGVIVGSVLVNKMAELQQDRAALLQEVPAILRSMREAMDA
ncbi:tryptophan synthase subunit alpha [Pokkaliibacter sp. MBI-7]|uniref:tryptophan synthase subunit alpha n=1 Tax=Pokkaliibacter sp. MBI-7 TaxID=3040600 RepID=UPI00244B8017|nr:tryptophan synthase subunit alpha [Pokkaliibacter sp. MBI-7]MDH2435095.1 tryptophan synthase subunit alpha [Pokkaliibacter sp. MBI-7]